MGDGLISPLHWDHVKVILNLSLFLAFSPDFRRGSFSGNGEFARNLKSEAGLGWKSQGFAIITL